MSSAIHRITNHNFNLDHISNGVGDWLDKHSTAHKIVLISNHLFKAVAIYGFMTLLPFSSIGNVLVTLGLSLFYKITVERSSKAQYDLSSCFGAISLKLSKSALTLLIDGIALSSLSLYGAGLLKSLPALIYGAYVIKTSSHEVNQAHRYSSFTL